MTSSTLPNTTLERLIPLGWRSTLALNSSILVALFFAYGFWWPYWRIADMDLWMVYEGMLFNSRLPQEYFDHTGYLNILLTGSWFWLGEKLGLLHAVSLQSLPRPDDTAGFEAAWSAATRAGRLLSLALALAFVAAFAFLLRKLLRDWRAAALGAIFLTYSGGLAMQARIMRTELIAAGLTTVSLLLLLIAGLRASGVWRPLLIGFAAFAAVLALTNKVQSIFLVAAFPFIALTFGRVVAPREDFWRSSRHATSVAIAYGAVSLAIAVLALPLIWFGLTHLNEAEFAYHPLFGVIGGSQALIAVGVVAMALIYARVWRVSVHETAAVLAAIAGGIGLGLLALQIRFHPQNVFAVVNPLEHLRYIASWTSDEFARADTVFSKTYIDALVRGAGTLLKRVTFVLQPSPRPTIFLEWFVIVATVVAWRLGERKAALQSAALIALASAFDLVSTLRGLKLEYFLYTDSIVIVAAGLLAVQVPSLLRYRYAYPVALVLIVAHVALSQAEPVKHSFKREIPVVFCKPHMDYTKRIETYPFCLRPPAAR